MSQQLLEVSGLSIGIKSSGAVHNAIEDISFQIGRGEILGIVGESGCGKSLTALALAGLLPEGVQLTGGQVVFNGVELTRLNKKDFRKIQGKDITMIFQEPMTSLNPLMKIGRQVSEVLQLHDNLTQKERDKRTIDILGEVGLPHPETIVNQYPHELSGGMRQRVMIAMAVISKPKLIIADEPTTALDVTIQAQILELLKQINRDYDCAILFISHDLDVISRLCDRVAVMYAGNIVEEAPTQKLFAGPAHPYAMQLMGAIPSRDKRGKRLANIPGRVPAISEKSAGCAFGPRCERYKADCSTKKPYYVELRKDHKVRCLLAQEESRKYGEFQLYS